MRQIWIHGLGTVVTAISVWLLVSYLSDWGLHLPAVIRVFHTLVLLGLPVFLGVRHVLRPLRRVPDRVGLAILLERAHPGTADLLVSAIQLGPRAAASPARALIARVVADAERTAAHLGVAAVLDRRGPRRRLATGGALGTLTALVLLATPVLSGIFLRRMLGADVSWPQRTHLRLEIPPVGDLRVETGPLKIVVRAARGSDVPILVHVEGVVPREVFLHFDHYESALTSGGTSPFRTLLRSVQEDLRFHVTGGDDRDGLPEVVLHVLQPPDVAAVAWEIEPPAYSGLASSLVHDPDIEVLQGSRVRVHMLPDPPGATGFARLLPEDRELPLERRPFPSPGADEEQDGLSFELVADFSLRVSFHLEDDTGLPNPDPGLFGITVVLDRRPEILMLAPGRAARDVVLGGAVPLRVRVEDDYGVASLEWDVRSVQNPDDALVRGTLTGHRISTPEALFGGGAREVLVAGVRLEVDELGGDQPPTDGQQLTLQVFATDNHEPLGNESPSAPVRLRIVSGDEFLRRLQDSLARASEQASNLARLGEERLRRTREVLAGLRGDEPGLDEGDLGDLGSMVHGARRVQGDARALARELASVSEGLLYSRVDDRAGPLLAEIDRALSLVEDRSFHSEPWRELHARYRAGTLGQAGLAGVLVEIVGLALEISEDHARAAADELAQAQDGAGAAALAALERAVAAQARAQEVIDQLLVKLGEWDNFQSVLTLTRDILKRQKNLEQRIRRHAEDK